MKCILNMHLNPSTIEQNEFIQEREREQNLDGFAELDPLDAVLPKFDPSAYFQDIEVRHNDRI